MTSCTFENCNRPQYGHGLCSGHCRQRRLGRALTPLTYSMTPIERMLHRRVITPNGCWEFERPRNNHGYGIPGRGLLAHRVAWEEWHGPIPEGLHVRHVVCSNPPCFNPEHLALGEREENMRDMAADGSQKGARNPRSKLTETDVRQIKVLLASGETGASIAARYGLTQQAVSLIKNGKRWGHV